MKEKRNILISLDILDIGGVETFVYNQSLAMKKKGHNVYILSKKGIFTEELKNKGINCIEFEFIDKIYYDFGKVQEILEIIEKYHIQEVHINQFSAMNVLLPACLIASIPYIVYLHMAAGIIENEELNAYNYFEKQFCTYTENFKLLFKYAHKIVAITPEIREYTIKRYQIEDTSKCIVKPNSINFDTYKSKTKVNQVKNILIVSRLSYEKLKGIINGIKLYQKIKEKSVQKVCLTIVGDGNKVEAIKKYIEDNQIQDIVFKGKMSNISEILEDHDLLIGVDRCVLEALAMKRLAVISGYDKLKGLLKGKITKDEIDENFCGKKLETVSIEEVANEIIKLDAQGINTIIEENYKVIRESLDIDNNIYVAETEDYKYKIEMQSFIKSMVQLNSIIGKKEEQAREKIESNWKEHVEYQEWIENQIRNLNEEKFAKESKRSLILNLKRILNKIINKGAYQWKKMKTLILNKYRGRS